MTPFQYAPKYIHKFLKSFEVKGLDFGKMYEQFYNPINYAIVGGIGVLINYLMFALLIGVFPWWITNILAILTAWTWNWSMSVGPFGYLWGFQKQTVKRKKKKSGRKMPLRKTNNK